MQSCTVQYHLAIKGCTELGVKTASTEVQRFELLILVTTLQRQCQSKVTLKPNQAQPR